MQWDQRSNEPLLDFPEESIPLAAVSLSSRKPFLQFADNILIPDPEDKEFYGLDNQYDSPKDYLIVAATAPWGMDNTTTSNSNGNGRKKSTWGQSFQPEESHEVEFEIYIEEEEQDIGYDVRMAASDGETELLQELINDGANVDGRDQHYELPPLHLAARDGHLENLVLLLQSGANFQEASGVSGSFPLHLAAAGNNVEVIEYLLGEGHAIDALDNHGFMAIHIAAYLGCQEAYEALLRHGADPTVPGSRYCRPTCRSRAVSD